MKYPLISEYVQSIMDSTSNLHELQNLIPVLDENGEPCRRSGTLAVVFKMKDNDTGNFYALKCFTDDQENREKAYKQICDVLEKISSPYFTKVLYIEKGIKVVSSCTAETEFPVLLMDWVEGDTMTEYVAKNYQDKQLMSTLCENISSMASWLRIQSFAHGDICPDNIIVKTDGSLTLVDYDGMYVPTMSGQKSPNLGTSAFRHPRRTIDDFDRTIDDFALASSTLSLKAISLKPGLLDDYGAPESLLFTEKDYNFPDMSRVFKELTMLLNVQEFYCIFCEFYVVLSLKSVSNSKAMRHKFLNLYPLKFKVNGVPFEMVNVDGGTFQMGCDDLDADADEMPLHSVTLSDYSIGKTQVTQALWTAVMGSNPSHFRGDNMPVDHVSWFDCQDFIKKLNSLTGKTFRLPTEAEWEFAARGGNKSKGYKYSGSDNIDDVAWYKDNSDKTTHPVASKQPNELGIYDMSGNVCEWCSDWYGEYSGNSLVNPTGVIAGSTRLGRGGSWTKSVEKCGSSSRRSNNPVEIFLDAGLRLALDLD